jgi:23S rRNA (pseudouridine1915-N3)-methyltransferase
MQIKLVAIGKTDHPALSELIAIYQKRLNFYARFEIELLPDIKKAKKLPEKQQKEKEGQQLLARIENTDIVWLLDEKGKQFTSVEFSKELQKKMNTGIKRLVFVIGGPYGFSEDVYRRANSKLSMAKMTFSHQMIRLFFTEQLYRAFTILKNEPYHHQ